MATKDYTKYLEAIRNSYARQGTALQEDSGGIVESLSLVADISKHPQAESLNDIEYRGSYLSRLRSKYFQEYLEYKKVSESITLPEWLSKEVASARETFVGVSVGVVEPQEEVTLPASEVTIPLAEEYGVLHTKPFGLTEDGYDNWVPPEAEVILLPKKEPVRLLDTIDLPEEELTSLEENNPYRTTKDIAPVLEEVLPKPSEDTLGFLYSEPLYVGEDGYDVWGDSGLGAIEVSVPEGDFVGEVYGTTADGYDVWVKPLAGSQEDMLTSAEVFSDLSEFSGKVVGTTKDGYDIWDTSKGPPQPQADEADEDKVEVGTFHGEVVGTTEDGYDVWAIDTDSGSEEEGSYEKELSAEEESTSTEEHSPEEESSNTLEEDSEDLSSGGLKLQHQHQPPGTALRGLRPHVGEEDFPWPTPGLSALDKHINANKHSEPLGNTSNTAEIRGKLRSSDRTAELLRNGFRRFSR